MKVEKSERAAQVWKSGAPIAARVLLGGFLAGLCNGLLGAGGGIIAVLFLSSLAGKDGESRRSIYVNALCVMLPLSVLTLFRYVRSGAASATAEPWTLLGAIVGGLLGGILLDKISGKVADRVFAVMTAVSGILMIIR